MQKHGIEIARGHGSQLAGIMTSTSEWPSFLFFVIIIIYCTCCVCNGTTLYLLLLRCIAPHIPSKITTHFFNLSFFLPILVWHAGDVPRRGECREALPYMSMLVVVCT